RRFSFCLSSRARVHINGKFCIVLLNTQCEEVSMKYAQLRFHFGRKCLAIRHRLLTEFFPPIESARQESNRAHGSLSVHMLALEGMMNAKTIKPQGTDQSAIITGSLYSRL